MRIGTISSDSGKDEATVEPGQNRARARRGEDEHEASRRPAAPRCDPPPSPCSRARPPQGAARQSSASLFPREPPPRPAVRPHPLEQMVPYPERVRHGGQCRIHGADAREDARVDDVEVVELVRLAVAVQDRLVRVGPRTCRCPPGARRRRPGCRSSCTRSGGSDGPRSCSAWGEATSASRRALLRLRVRLRVAQFDVAVRLQRDAVVRPGQILGREPEVDRVSRDPVERPLGR